MSDTSDYGDSIDWDEAIIAVDAAESVRRALLEAEPASRQDAAAAARPEDGKKELVDLDEQKDELLLVYGLLEGTDEHDLDAPAALGDIEDLGCAPSLHVQEQRSLFDRFRRKRGFLSVTDLTAPSGWCEVQYSYSLLGRRDLKPEDRPDRIVTSSGKEIKVDKKIAIAHEKVLEKGRQVHKVLEREVHPEQVLVETKTKADAWGLRMLNQIISLTTLRDTGKAREIPVFGFIEGIFVLGVMDEIIRRPLPGQEKPASEPAVPETPPDQHKISHFFSARARPTKKAPPEVKQGLYLVDSKTRRVNSMPRAAYTVASHYQLMLYKRLFDVHASDQLDWPRFWAHINLAPTDALSPTFLEQTKLLCLDSGLEALLSAQVLGDFASVLRSLHAELGMLQDQLELVYRWRSPVTPARSEQKRRAAPELKRQPSIVSIDSSSDEDEAVQLAITASLVAARSPATPLHNLQSSGNALARTDEAEAASSTRLGSATASLSTPIKPSQAPASPYAVSTTSSPASPLNLRDLANKAEDVQDQTAGRIIGTDRFMHDEDKMLDYIRDVIAFWQGREPRGVAADEVSSKCRNCEFQDGCEWLAAKAEEHRQRVATRKAR